MQHNSTSCPQVWCTQEEEPDDVDIYCTVNAMPNPTVYDGPLQNRRGWHPADTFEAPTRHKVSKGLR
jgi:hypothetical protein